VGAQPLRLLPGQLPQGYAPTRYREVVLTRSNIARLLFKAKLEVTQFVTSNESR